MSPVKRFFLKLLAVYLVVAVLVLVVVGPPQLSGDYLEEYQADHDRYLEIIHSPEYKKHVQNPELHPAEGALAEDLAFVEEYEARPEFQAAAWRRDISVFLFECLNAGALLAIAIRFGRKPLLEFLDQQVADARKRLEWAQENRRKAEERKKQAQQQLDTLDQRRREITAHTQTVIQQERERIRNATEENLAQIETETNERIRVEELRTTLRIKRELVEQAVGELRERYAAERSEETLAQLVEDFARSLERTS